MILHSPSYRPLRPSSLVPFFPRQPRWGTRGTSYKDDVVEICGDALITRKSFGRMRGEPDIEKRRQMAASIGPSIGALDRALQRSHESDRFMAEPASIDFASASISLRPPRPLGRPVMSPVPLF